MHNRQKIVNICDRHNNTHERERAGERDPQGHF